MSLEYWEYFLAIESDLENCCRYVEFSSDNYGTYSIEFARIIMAASAEFDTLAKNLCQAILERKLKPNEDNINKYNQIMYPLQRGGIDI